MYENLYNNVKQRVSQVFDSSTTAAVEDTPSVAPPSTEGAQRLEAGRQRRGIFDRQRQRGEDATEAMMEEQPQGADTESYINRTSAFLRMLEEESDNYMKSQQEEQDAEFIGAFGADGAEFDAPPSTGLAGRRPPRKGAFPASLVQSESGGNWKAFNNEVGAGGVRGHGGRLQFGYARLQDAAKAGVIPKGMTAQEFSRQSPEVQMAVEDWHFSDIDRRIESNDLEKYIGKKINGITVTIDGMRAVAHLGGMNGLIRYLRSDGTRNPADSFGTSLTDYMRMHAGTTKREE